MKHWANKFVGRPWQPGGCWLLLQDVFRDRHGIDMPPVQVGESGDAENVAALKIAAERSGWRRVEDEPKPDDILQMRDLDGFRHVGYVVNTFRGLSLLHSHGYMSKRGPVGQTVCQSLRDVRAIGFVEFECWRKA